MKKILSVLLCVAMLVSGLVMFTNAEEPEQYPIVFVTGIGQSYSYLFDSAESATADMEDGIPDDYITRWNLFCNDFSFFFKEIPSYINIVRLLGGLVCTVATGKNYISEDCVDDIVTSLFRYNTIDSNGQLPGCVYTPLQKCSVADMEEYARDNFYRSIPCQDVIGDVGEDMLYCFNYSAFSFTYDNAENLSKFINEVVLPQTEAEKVVLVPMSMGASVVSAYLHDHGTEGKVARVVSIVGAWYGSDVLADLAELKYSPDAPDMLYNGIVADLVGQPWGNLINLVLRIMPKQTLRNIIDEILGSIVDNLLAKTPSLMGLVPCDRYPDIRKNVLEKNSGAAYILPQTDKYQECQSGLKDRLLMLNKDYGVEFYFIAGYGLKFGGFSSDYEFFQFFQSADTTNSDEIIQISSTVPGSTFAKAGTALSDEYLAGKDAKYITPDKSVDVSTSIFPDNAWLFYGQKHELENNNTALALAFDLATGKITSVEDGEDTYPRFNNSRDVKKLKRDYIPDLEKWLAENTPTADQQALIEKNTAAVNDMMARTLNDREADDKIINDYYDMLVSLGVYTEGEPNKAEEVLGVVLGGLNNVVYKVVGARGFSDFINSLISALA